MRWHRTRSSPCRYVEPGCPWLFAPPRGALTGNRPPELSDQQVVSLGLDIVGDEARTLFGCEGTGHGDRASMVGVVCIEQSEDGARIPEDGAGHRSRMACLSRAPGVLPPPRPAPTRRKIGWSLENADIAAVRRRRVCVRTAVAWTSRRPLRRTLGSSPRRISRQTVERETPSARPASSTVINRSATPKSYHDRLIVSIVSSPGA